MNHSAQTVKQAGPHTSMHTHVRDFMLDASLSRHLVLSNTLWNSKSYNIAPGEFGSI